MDDRHLRYQQLLLCAPGDSGRQEPPGRVALGCRCQRDPSFRTGTSARTLPPACRARWRPHSRDMDGARRLGRWPLHSADRAHGADDHLQQGPAHNDNLFADEGGGDAYMIYDDAKAPRRITGNGIGHKHRGKPMTQLYPPDPQQPATALSAPRPAPTSGLAIASLTLGIIGMCVPFAGARRAHPGHHCDVQNRRLGRSDRRARPGSGRHHRQRRHHLLGECCYA